MDVQNEEALVSVEKLGKIVFRAFNTKKQQSVVVTPLNDMTGQLYTGQGSSGYFESLTPAEKNGLAIVFDNRSKYVVSSGKVLNIDSDNHHAAMWKWIKRHPYIAMNKESKTPDSVFYVDNPQREAENFVSRDKRITKVKTAVYNATTERKSTVARAMGLVGAEGLNDSQIEEWLIMKCEEIPDSVSKLIDPKNASVATAMVLVKEMLTYGIIRRFNTVFKYGGSEGVTLGNDEDSVADWINDSNNEETILAMRLEVNEKKGLS